MGCCLHMLGQPMDPSPQPLLPSIPPANETLVLQHQVNIYSVQTILELKA